MSSDPAVRTLRLPPADFPGIQIPRTRQPARNWFRVHRSRRAAAAFSLTTSHRFSHRDCPYAILYLGVDIDTCLFERFGDLLYDGKKAIPHSLWAAHSVSTVRVPEVHVCDLTTAKTLSAMMVDLTALMHHELSTPQAWGRVIQEHPAQFQAIKFKSRFNTKACLALFQRDDLQARLREKALDALSNNDVAASWLEKHRVSLY